MGDSVIIRGAVKILVSAATDRGPRIDAAGVDCLIGTRGDVCAGRGPAAVHPLLAAGEQVGVVGSAAALHVLVAVAVCRRHVVGCAIDILVPFVVSVLGDAAGRDIFVAAGRDVPAIFKAAAIDGLHAAASDIGVVLGARADMCGAAVVNVGVIGDAAAIDILKSAGRNDSNVVLATTIDILCAAGIQVGVLCVTPGFDKLVAAVVCGRVIGRVRPRQE